MARDRTSFSISLSVVYAIATFTAGILADDYSCPARSCCPANYTKPNDPSTGQLQDYTNAHQNQTQCILTSFGTFVDSQLNWLRVGPRGPLVLGSPANMEVMQHFDRERIPERVVHANGAGAHGTFVCTGDITKYTKLAPFRRVGEKTKIFVRFSQVIGERGSADCVRDIRGFAVRWYTGQGNWDVVGLNAPVFWIYDPIRFISLIHSQKRNPVTNLPDPNAMFSFIACQPTTLYIFMLESTGIGTPDCYQNMEGHGVHTFTCVNAKNEIHYCKFHWLPPNGTKNLTNERSVELAGTDPNYNTRCLYNAIADGHYPSWDFYIQVMTPKQAKNYHFDAFDPTKDWPREEFPYIHCGRLTLDKNPSNYFAEVEQVAFSPSHMPEGITIGPDNILLEARTFSYPDTQLYRLGANANQLPINKPIPAVTNYERDGAALYCDQDGAPNVYPNCFNGPVECPQGRVPPYEACGTVDNHESPPDDFYFPRRLWNEQLNDTERALMVKTIASRLGQAYECVQDKVLALFARMNTTFSEQVERAMGRRR